MSLGSRVDKSNCRWVCHHRHLGELVFAYADYIVRRIHNAKLHKKCRLGKRKKAFHAKEILPLEIFHAWHCEVFGVREMALEIAGNESVGIVGYHGVGVVVTVIYNGFEVEPTCFNCF